MALKDKLTEDMKAAMKGGDKDRLGVIRLINAANPEWNDLSMDLP